MAVTTQAPRRESEVKRPSSAWVKRKNGMRRSDGKMPK